MSQPRAAAAAALVAALSLLDMAGARLGQPEVEGVHSGASPGPGNATLSEVPPSVEPTASAPSSADSADGTVEVQPVNGTDLGGRSVGGSGPVLRMAAAAESSGTFGYAARSSTTLYGNAKQTSCGGMDTEALVAGTGYYSVASSQAMQSLFKNGDSCCYCGAGSATAWSQGTVPMGCFSCGRGRFLAARPYNGMNAAGGFASPEIKVVVADVCPGGAGNEGWCQKAPGDVNMVGERNHLDFSSYPHGIDNNFFVFTPEPCSPQLKARMVGGAAKCWR